MRFVHLRGTSLLPGDAPLSLRDIPPASWEDLKLPSQRLPSLLGSWHREAVTEGQFRDAAVELNCIAFFY